VTKFKPGLLDMAIMGSWGWCDGNAKTLKMS